MRTMYFTDPVEEGLDRMSRQGTATDDGSRMSVIHEVNAELAKLDDRRSVQFLDIGARFLGADGKIPDDVMTYQLHLSPQGYQICLEL